jgi:hypothetical protein
VLDDWNPDDDEQESVFYDLSDWGIDAQTEVSATFADRGIRYAWRGFELAVPAEHESMADAAFEAVERRLGLGGGDASAATPTIEELEAIPGAITEYELDDLGGPARATLGRALDDLGIPHRFDTDVLLVPTVTEEAVDEILAAVESGDVVLLDTDDDTEDIDLDDLVRLARRLERAPLDPRVLADLDAFARSVDGERPPFGISLAVWRRVDELLGVGLAAAHTVPPDEIAVVEAAEALRALLRPYT